MAYPIERYLNIRAAYYPGFSADGRFLSFISNITGRAQAWQVDLTNFDYNIPWPRQLTFAEDRVMSIHHVPYSEDGWLLYTHDVGGNENAQIYLHVPGGSKDICLTEGHDKVMHILGDWSPDGDSIYFAANRRHPAQFDIYRQSLTNRAAELIWRHECAGYLLPAAVSPDGQFVAIVRAARSFSHELFELNLKSGKVEQISPLGQDARFATIYYSKNGRFLYVNTDLDADFMQIMCYDRTSQSWEPLIHPDWDAEMMTLSPNGRFLAYAVNQDGNSKLELFDLTTNKTLTAPLDNKVPGVIGQSDSKLEFSPDSRRLAFSYTTATFTSDMYIWDFKAQSVTQATQSSHGGLPADSFVAPQLIHYPTFDGRQIPAWYYPANKADASKPAPVIMLVHGGPESQFRPYFHFMVQYYIQNGYAVLAPNVRGSTGYGKAYSHLDDVEKRMDSVTDLAFAAQWLKTQSGIDSDRIVVYGGSYGGFMVLSALTTYPDLWAAGIDVVGISNFVTFLENTSDYRRSHRESEYGSLVKDRAFLESISPLNQTDQIQAPLMVIHGANDPRVPISEAEQLVKALKKRNVPVEFLVYEDEGHGIVKLKNKLSLYPAVAAFLEEMLG